MNAQAAIKSQYHAALAMLGQVTPADGRRRGD